jgi:hypothetical protein
MRPGSSQADRRHAGGTRMAFRPLFGVDPYGFVFYTWGVRRELPMAGLKNSTAFKDRMLARSAVRRVAADEKVKV